MTRTALALISLFTILGVPSAARACSCAAPAGPEEALEQATAAFSGKVTEINQPLFDRLGFTESGEQEVNFEVIKAWKGVAGTEVLVRTRLTGEACGFPFTLGGTYLVFVHEIQPGIETGICTGTRDLADADDEIQALDAVTGK